MPGGRPTKYKKRYCEDVIEHMKNGASFNSFAAKIEVDDSQLRRWRQKYPEFYTACKIAEKKSLDWWENFAMQAATGRLHDPAHKGKYKHHNVGMIQFIMKQRFYRDYNKGPSQAIEVDVKPKVTYQTSISNDGRLVQDVLEDVMKEDEKK